MEPAKTQKDDVGARPGRLATDKPTPSPAELQIRGVI